MRATHIVTQQLGADVTPCPKSRVAQEILRQRDPVPDLSHREEQPAHPVLKAKHTNDVECGVVFVPEHRVALEDPARIVVLGKITLAFALLVVDHSIVDMAKLISGAAGPQTQVGFCLIQEEVGVKAMNHIECFAPDEQTAAVEPGYFPASQSGLERDHPFAGIKPARRKRTMIRPFEDLRPEKRHLRTLLDVGDQGREKVIFESQIGIQNQQVFASRLAGVAVVRPAISDVRFADEEITEACVSNDLFRCIPAAVVKKESLPANHLLRAKAVEENRKAVRVVVSDDAY